MAAKRIKMPETIRLAGRSVKLEIADESSIGEDTVGRYRSTQGKIQILRGMPDDHSKSVFVHELMHDLDHQSGNNLTETQVNSLSALLFAALRDNPKLVAWLMS